MGQLRIEFDLFGRPKTTATGFDGGACKSHIERLDKIFGGEGKKADTPDMLLTETETQKDSVYEF